MAVLTISIILIYSLKSYSAVMRPKIVGGLDASIDDWPFIAFIGYYRWDDKLTSICGGSLISSQTVLTAAHCLDDTTEYKKVFYKFKNVTVKFGSANMMNSTEIRSGVDYLTYPGYNLTATNHDIGVLFLDSPVTFSDTVKKIMLLNRPLNDKEQLIVAGWGVWSEPANKTHPLKSNLQFLPHTYIPKEICERKVQDFILDTGTICAGTSTNHKFVFRMSFALQGSSKDVICSARIQQECHSLLHLTVIGDHDTTAYRDVKTGDSGGPLVSLDGLQVGVVSYKIESDGITIFTFVPYYLPWIKQAQVTLAQKYCGRIILRTTVEDGLTVRKDALLKCD